MPDFQTPVLILLILYVIAQTIARITPTKKDDEIVGTIGKILNTLFLKSRTQEEADHKARDIVLEEVLHYAADRYPELVKQAEKIADKVAKKTNAGDAAEPTRTTAGKRVIELVNAKLSNLIEK